MKNFFGILGGMGTMASETLVREINYLTPADSDQDYLNYMVFNDAQIPDRTAYILDHTKPNPWFNLAGDVRQLNELGAQFIVMACNTAHYFLDQLKQISQMPILDMPALAVKACLKNAPRKKGLKIGILGTSGTLKTQIYQNKVQTSKNKPILPDISWQRKVMAFIYQDIKQKNLVEKKGYYRLLDYMLKTKSCDFVILGCTELSVAQKRKPYNSPQVIDAQNILAQKTVQLAKKMQNK